MQPKKIDRNYEGSDNYLLARADTITKALDTDLADFTTFDTTMDATWLVNFKADTTTALTQDSDELVLSQQSQLSNDVNDAMQAGKDIYTDIIYFAKKAFPNDKAKLQEFGYGDKYNKAGKNQSLMVDFLEELHRTATKYSIQLIAKGTTAAAIAAIETACTTLRNLNADQNLFIIGRPVISQERVKALNLVYSYISQTRDAAERVYDTNFAKQNKYSFNPPVQEDGFSAVNLLVAPNTIDLVTELLYSPDRIIQLRNKGTVALVLGLSDNGTTFTGTPVTVAPAAETEVTAAQLAASGNFLLLQNSSADTIAEAKVRWQD